MVSRARSDEWTLPPASPPLSAPAGRSSRGERSQLLTLLVPSLVFLDDDIESLLSAHGRGAGDGWLAILLVAEPTWTAEDLATATINVKKRADAALVASSEAGPKALDEALETLFRVCPVDGAVVFAWPGSTDAGLALLRHARQRHLEDRSVEAASSEREAVAAEPPVAP